MKTIDFASFNTAGNLRGFTSAPEKEAKKRILTDMKEGLLILPLKNLSVIPERMLNMMYIKTSKNNDLAEILKICTSNRHGRL